MPNSDKYDRSENAPCGTPFVTEDEVKAQFLKAFNQLMANRDELVADCRLAKTAITNTQELDAELAGLYREREVVIELSRKAIQHNAHTAQDQTEFNQLNDSYLERERVATERIAELESIKRERVAKGKTLDRFIRDIKTRPLILTEFDEPLWTAVVERVTVTADGSLAFEFRNGTTITT